MYCGSRRIDAISSAHVSSAAAAGAPAPSTTRTPRSVQASRSICEPARPVCAMSFNFGSFPSRSRVMRVRSRIRTNASESESLTPSCPAPLTVLLKTLTSWPASRPKQSSLRTASW